MKDRSGPPTEISSGTYDAANELTQLGTTSVTYDANGNVTDDGTNTYTWDSRNQLASITGPVNAQFQYDAFGRRVSKTVGGATTGFLYDGQNAVQELSSGTPSATILSGLATDELFARTDASGQSSFVTDALGSTLALTDGSGNNVAQYSYDAFGGAAVTGSSANANQYTGRENDGTGADYYRARYYDPALGRFLSEDPLEFNAGSLNLYSYAGNDPVDYTDPSGAQFLAGCAIGAGINLTSDAIAGRKQSWGGRFRSAVAGRALGALGGELFGAGELAVAEEEAAALAPTAEEGMTQALTLRPVVIGENMERVNVAARTFGADVYEGYPNVEGLAHGSQELTDARLAHNGEWIREQIAQARTIIDIGPAPNYANYPGVTSDAYSVELYEIEHAGYGNVIRPY